MTATPSRRSLLYAPADDTAILESAFDSEADGVVCELEDGVDGAAKADARDNVECVVPGLSSPDTEVCVRINSLKSDCWMTDLDAALAAGVDTVVLPKVDYGHEVRTLASVVRQLTTEAERPDVIVALERPRGVFYGREIAEVCAEIDVVTAAYQGYADYCEYTGASSTNDEIRHFLNRLLVGYAGLAGIEPIAPADVRVEDADRVRAFAERCSEMGYDGQLALHPAQVEVLNDVYSPSRSEYEQARHLVSTYRESEAGSMVVDGVFLDRPVVNRYVDTVRQYEAIHDIEPTVEYDFLE
ncbi:HpcH/HpaI aldolase/citrate lyase family protein [Halomicrobium salinisoli]|uniref:HpcH/HpaI aldolase/citrate lyase family protein n=1 Tax=Halomicrobium salinisoli TaxID=2878391 RepID=UPI001CF0CE7E|nr:CoA ester lyase [Halomicrobium salinisoli]